MTEAPFNRNGRSARPLADLPEPDAFGQAALLLAESTLDALVKARALTAAQALDAVRTAAAVKLEFAAEIGEKRSTMRASLDLLHRIERSIETMNASDI